MWIVAKIKKKEIEIFKKELIERMGKDLEFYYPKIECHQYIGNKVKVSEKLALESYVFCYHKNFTGKNISRLKFIKGLNYFLDGCYQNQKDIINFITYCKRHENKNGYLTQGFFKNIISKKAQFLSGPFTNMMFEIIEKQKNKLKVLMGNIVTTVSDNKNYLYRSV